DAADLPARIQVRNWGVMPYWSIRCPGEPGPPAPSSLRPEIRTPSPRFQAEKGRVKLLVVADVGRLLLVFGVLLVVIGGALMLFGRFHLPGDLSFRSGNTTVYVPIATSIILSIVLTVVLNLVFRQR